MLGEAKIPTVSGRWATTADRSCTPVRCDPNQGMLLNAQDSAP